MKTQAQKVSSPNKASVKNPTASVPPVKKPVAVSKPVKRKR